jgi:uroporphyrinogen-III synthase
MTLSDANRKHPLIAAIGPATARALKSIGLTPDLIPPQAIAESLTESLRPHARQLDGNPTRFLLVRAEDARDLLPDTLRAAGAEVTIAPAYRTIIPEGSIRAIRQLFQQGSAPPDAVTFTSSSTARNLLALCEAAGVDLPPSALRASIGPITSATLRELGYPPHAEAPSASIEALAQAVYDCLTPEPGV